MSTVATITVIITNPRLNDPTVMGRISSISFTNELEDHGLVSPATSDSTTVAAPGSIQRVIVADMTATFMASYPLDADRISALQGWIIGSLSERVPFIQSHASETVVLS